MREDEGRCGKMREDVGRCGKMREDEGRCGKMWEDVGKKGNCTFMRSCPSLQSVEVPIGYQRSTD